MPEIIPNWHPALVHFPIALTITATLLLLLGRVRPASTLLPACARLLIHFAALSAVLAVVAGWHAFETVEHGAAGHRVMLRHRAWALAGATGLLLLALWEARGQRNGRAAGTVILPIMLLLSGILVVTAWLGGEMVYRHGVGVSSSAFATPIPLTEQTPTLPATIPTPESTPESASSAVSRSEHIHQDGKRHRH